MTSLNRIQVGKFLIDQAITIEQLEEQGKNVPFLTIEELFQQKPALELTPKRLKPFLNGVKLTFRKPNGVYRIYCENKFIGIGIVENEFLKRDIVLD